MGEKIIANDLYEYLEYIRKRPGLFLGSKSISVLYNFIFGYQTACCLKELEENLVLDLEGFHDFVNDYYLHGPSTAGWKNVILAQHYGREEDAFDDFFRLLDLFKEGYPHVNSRNIILQLIQKIINNPLCLSAIIEDNIIVYLKNLPSKLEEGQSLYNYDSILYDLREMAVKDQMLSKLISEVAGSNEWSQVE